MTIVILLGGIDLSVGSVMGFSSVICAMLLTKPGWTPAAVMGVPAATLASFLAVALPGAVRVQRPRARARRRGGSAPRDRAGRLARLSDSRRCSALPRRRRRRVRFVAGSDQIRRPRGPAGDALLRVDAWGDQRRVHRRGTAAALHRHAGDDGQRAWASAASPAARTTRSSQSTPERTRPKTFEILRSMVWGLVPMPSIFFLVTIIAVRRDPAFHHLRPLRLRDRRQRRGGEALRHQGRAGAVRRLCHFRHAGRARRRLCSSRNIARANRTPGRASSSTRSPRSSSAAPA